MFLLYIYIILYIQCPAKVVIITVSKLIYLQKASFELLLVGGAFFQLSIKLLNAFFQLLRIPANLSQSCLNASCLP